MESSRDSQNVSVLHEEPEPMEPDRRSQPIYLPVNVLYRRAVMGMCLVYLGRMLPMFIQCALGNV